MTQPPTGADDLERPDGTAVGRWGKSATGERLKGANALSLHVPEPLTRPCAGCRHQTARNRFDPSTG